MKNSLNNLIIGISSKLSNKSIKILNDFFELTELPNLKDLDFEYYFSLSTSDEIESIYKKLLKIANSIELKYYDFEIFSFEDFQYLRKYPNQRLLSRKKMCLYIESHHNKLIKTKFEIENIENIEIQIGNLKIDNQNFIEKIWYNWGKYLEYDEWQITTAKFIPINYIQFISEISEFSKYWNINKRYFKVNNFSKQNIILRNINEWDCLEYIIFNSDENNINYLGANAYY